MAEILEADQDLRPDINGHTDNTVKAESILLLSRKRAQSVYDYLAKKEADRSKNRRVELKSHYD